MTAKKPRSPDAAQRNPGIAMWMSEPRISLRSIRATSKVRRVGKGAVFRAVPTSFLYVRGEQRWARFALPTLPIAMTEKPEGALHGG
jgi:hypothetical protein